MHPAAEAAHTHSQIGISVSLDHFLGIQCYDEATAIRLLLLLLFCVHIKYTRSTNINIKSCRNSKINWSRLPNLWKIDFLSWAARLSCHFSVTLGVLVHLVWIRPLKRSIVRHSRSVIIIRDEWHCQWWNDELIGNNGRSLPNRNTADLTMINERMNDRTNNQWKRKMEQTTTNRIKENRRKRWKITYYIMIAILHSIQCNESAASRTHTHKHPDHFFEMQTAIYLGVCV